MGDGWLPSAVTPEEIAEGVSQIKEWTGVFQRQVPDDHYGVFLTCCIAGSRVYPLKMAGPHILRRREDAPLQRYMALGPTDGIREMVREYLSAGATKFVLRPACPPEAFLEQCELLAREVIAPLQTPFGD